MLDDLAAAYAQALALIGGAFVEAFTDLLSAFDLSDRASAERLVPVAHRGWRGRRPRVGFPPRPCRNGWHNAEGPRLS